MFEEIGEFLGGLIIFFYSLTILNFVVKFILRKYGLKIKKYPKFHTFYLKLTKIIVRYHKLFGFLTIISILSHFLIQLTNERLSIFRTYSGVLHDISSTDWGLLSLCKTKKNDMALDSQNCFG